MNATKYCAAFYLKMHLNLRLLGKQQNKKNMTRQYKFRRYINIYIYIRQLYNVTQNVMLPYFTSILSSYRNIQ